MKRVITESVFTRAACLCLLAQAAAAAEFFVSPDGAHQPPFSDWGAAATNIQDAVDLAGAGSTVWVSNGVYQSGWRTNYPSGTVLKSRLVITNAVTVRSLDPDPAQTVIMGSRDPDTQSNGSNAVRCVYMRGGASLIGFTVTNGATMVPPPMADLIIPNDNHNGGGIFVYDSGTVSNCIIAGNLAGAFGAGLYKGTAFDCEIVGNRARTDGTMARYGGGGGASTSTLRGCRLANNVGHYGSAMYYGTASNSWFTGNASTYTCYMPYLYNCLIVSNTSSYAVRATKQYNCTVANNKYWGVHQESTFVNCIVYFNASGNCYTTNIMAYTCTTPSQSNWLPGDGNITADPAFLNRSAGNYRLPRNSPCVDAGTNGVWTANGFDLDNRRRIDKVTDIADMGCYEYVYPVRGTMCTFR